MMGAVETIMGAVGPSTSTNDWTKSMLYIRIFFIRLSGDFKAQGRSRRECHGAFTAQVPLRDRKERS